MCIRDSKESVSNESDNINDSGLETTPNLIDENNLTQSVIMSGAKAESTPVTNRAKELSLDDLFNFMRTMSSDINIKFDKIDRRFDPQNSNFSKKCEQQNIQLQQSISVKFDELINNIQEKNKRLENTNERKNSLNKVEQSESNTNENCNDMCRNVVLDKELTNQNSIENSDLIENVVSESTDEFVACDYEMLMYAYELERERKNSIVVEWGQRVNFSLFFLNQRVHKYCLRRARVPC